MLSRPSCGSAEPSIAKYIFGRDVGSLLGIFTQIDVAKGELAKRFVMKSDVLRDNKDCK